MATTGYHEKSATRALNRPARPSHRRPVRDSPPSASSHGSAKKIAVSPLGMTPGCLAHHSSGKIESQPELLPVSDVVESAVEANRTAIAEAGLELQINLEDPSRLLEVDPVRLSQVVSNVLHNAPKFTPRGGRITLTTELPAGGSVTRELILRVTDTGVGIAKESLPKVFGLFAQLHTETSVRHGGLGIGLAPAQSRSSCMVDRSKQTVPGAGRAVSLRSAFRRPRLATQRGCRLPARRTVSRGFGFSWLTITKMRPTPSVFSSRSTAARSGSLTTILKRLRHSGASIQR